MLSRIHRFVCLLAAGAPCAFVSVLRSEPLAPPALASETAPFPAPPVWSSFLEEPALLTAGLPTSDFITEPVEYATAAQEDDQTGTDQTTPAGPAIQKEAYLGARVQFTANVTGTDFTYQWFKNGIPLSDNAHIQGSATPLLTIDKLTLSDSGTYTLSASSEETISCWGDSMTSDPYLAALSQLTHLPVFDGGIGGQTSTQIRDRMLATASSWDDHTVIWAGRNTPYIPMVLSDVASMVNALGHQRYLVLSVLNGNLATERRGGAGYDNIISLNQQLAQAHPGHFVDIRAWLISEGLTLAGIPATAQDQIDIADDLVPASLRSDGIHLTDACSALVAQKVAQELAPVIAADPRDPQASKWSTPIALTVLPTVLPSDLIVSWRLAYFATETASGESANLADPDGDGFSNLLEYATGTPPRQINVSPVTLSRNGSFLTITYPRIADPSITYTVEGASDPAGPWQALAVPGNPATGSTAGLFTVIDTVSLDSGTSRFLRLQVKKVWPTDPLKAWRLIYFGQTDSAEGADTADPDSDGLANLLEYATGTSPLHPDSEPALLARSGPFLTLTYQRIPDPALIYTVEGASDPAGPWQTIAAADNPLTLSETAGPVTVTDTVSLDENPQRFLRLRIGRVWAADPFDAWRLTYFAASPDAEEAAAAGDPDHDGIPNLLEYASGTPPHRLSPRPTALGRSGSFLTLTYSPIADPALTYTVEAAADLAGPWETIETANNPLTGSESSDPVTVTDTAPLETNPNRFLRLRVSH